MGSEESTEATNTVTFNLTEDDILQVVHLKVWDSFRSWRVVVSLSLWWIVLTAFFAFHERFIETPWTLAILGLLFAVLLPSAVFLMQSIVGPINASREYRQNKLIKATLSAAWDQEYYKIERPGHYNCFPWRDYIKWKENDAVFLFYLSRGAFFILPKRVLSQPQLKSLREILPSSGKWTKDR